jgi:3-methyladenine DNA glycosylase AlkD
MKRAPSATARKKPQATADTGTSVAQQAEATLAWLKREGSQRGRDAMARYAIPSDKAFGVSVGNLQKQAKKLGRSHALAAALWESGWYEARMMAAYVDDPAQVTAAQMDRWCRDFDNWAICDTICFALFDRTPHAWSRVEAWARRREEYMKRAAFALLWGLSVHDKSAADARFIEGLALVERAADDERQYVRKAVNMALRAIGKRNAKLNAAAAAVAKRLAASRSASAQWVGKDALRELTSASVARRLTARS